MSERDLFISVLQREAAERAAFLRELCPDDAELRARVEILLRAHEAASGSADGSSTTEAFVPDGTESQARMEHAGAVIGGKYTLIERIGEGGMGSVWMAQQSEPVKRLVAVKVIKSGMDSAQVITRFEAERQALAVMDHPNIAKILDGGVADNGSPYFVMELVKGISITKYCDELKLTPRQRLELFVPVCQAIQHAHQKGIIHRDIKPSNVMVALYDERAVPKVIDFGVAKATGQSLTEQTFNTDFGGIVGTAEYMSPEQASLNNLDIDTRSDIYSLGILLYELLAGSPPFKRRELQQAGLLEILRVIREDEPPRPSTKLSTADALPSLSANRGTEPQKLTGLLRNELDWIVMKALEKDRSRRYETANGFAADINRYLAGEPVQAHPPSTAYRVRKFLSKHRGAMIASGLVASSILIGLALAVTGFIQASRQRDLAVAAEHHASTEAARAAAAEAQAVAEAKSATQIAEFLASMLKGVGPQIALGRDTTLLREIVDGTAVRVEKELADQPIVASRLLSIVAGVYSDLANYDTAEKLARKSLELTRQIPGDNRLLLARALFGVAYVLEATGNYADAKSKFQEAYELFKDAGHGETEEGWRALNGVGGVCYRVKDYKSAEPIFRQVLAGRKLLANGGDTKSVADSLDRLALVVGISDGKLAESEALQREALAMRRRLFGELHPDVALSLTNLSRTLSEEKQFAESIALCEQAIEQHRKLFGERHPHTAAVLATYAMNLAAAGRTADAVAPSRQVLEINRENFGPNHRRTLDANFNLGSLLDLVKDYRGAEEQFRAMLAWGRANYPVGDNRTSAVIMLVAKAVMNQGRHAEAEALFREALDARLGNKANPRQVAESRNALADCLIAQQRRADAEPLLIAIEKDARENGATPAARAAAIERLVAFCTAWHTVEQDQGHDAKAATWKAKLEALNRAGSEAKVNEKTGEKKE